MTKSPFDIAVNYEGFDIRASAAIALGELSSVWKRIPSDEHLAWMTLENMWVDEEVVEVAPGRWRLPFDSAVGLEASVSRNLGLPLTRKLELYLTSNGVPGRDSFKIDIDCTHSELGRLNNQTRIGAAFQSLSGEWILADQKAWAVIDAVDRRPDREDSLSKHLAYIGRVKETAVRNGARMDPFLSNQDIQVVDNISIEVSGDADRLTIEPKAGNLSAESLFVGDRPRKVVSKRDGANVSRMVMSELVREQLGSVGRSKNLEDAQVPEFLVNPEAFLPSGIDLSAFSGRVRGLTPRVYNSRPYLHVGRTKGGWFDFDAGVKTENLVDADGAAGPVISAEAYEELAASAADSGNRFVKFGDDWIEIDPTPAQQFSETIQKLERAGTRPGQITADFLLDVFPNTETLEFELVVPEDLGGTARPWMAELPFVMPPDTFKGELFPHQLLGFRWLHYLHSHGCGGLLADQMGVGKTPQVLAHLAELQRVGNLRPSLLVLPKSLIENWSQELQKFTPSLARSARVFMGSGRTRDPDVLSGVDLTLTTYETIRRDQFVFGQVDWKTVVCDEAQFIKNPTAGRTSAIKALKAEQTLALTGTPVENGLIEFWCILDYVRPGLLRSWREFRDEYERPLATAQESSDREQVVENLLSHLDPHYLRREKAEVLKDLPEKVINYPHRTELSAAQRELYRQVLDEVRTGGRGAALAGIQKLLRICAHHRAMTDDWDTVSGGQLIAECPKLAKTIEILDEIKYAQEKALIFTTWKAPQFILQKAIGEHFSVWPRIINGDVTGRRIDIIEEFCKKPGFGVMILSPEVAGYGLNIVEANHVIHYTRPWNPAKEDQATDRVHRMGQSKTVMVYYPTNEHTVEERLATLLQEKSQLATDVLRPTAERSVSIDELMDGL